MNCKALKLIISDCHLSAGRKLQGQSNPHEDFHYDDEMVEFIGYFDQLARDRYGSEVELELVLNGDFLDFLNVPVRGEFEELITEIVALEKTEAILMGHAKVFRAFREFVSKPNRRITYLIGNHDAELLFPGVRERLTLAMDPERKFPSDRVQVLAQESLDYPDLGIQIRHGNQLEVGSDINYARPLIPLASGQEVLNLPWSSSYVLKVINPLKHEREHLDKIRPIKVFVLLGLFVDPLFTIRFSFLSLFYFIKTRIAPALRSWREFKHGIEVIRSESKLFLNLEEEARVILDQVPWVQCLVLGHTHRPMHREYADGKQYANSGTWTKMVDLDWRLLNAPFRRTFVFLEAYEEEGQPKVRCRLEQWLGPALPHVPFVD